MRSRGRFIGGVICTIIGVLFLVAVIATCMPMIVPKIMGNGVYTIISGSMEPTIPVGSLIIVEPCSNSELAEGDVIAFIKGGSVVSHRVVENHVIEGSLITKGDANELADATEIPYTNVIGKIKTHIPVLGDYMQIFSSLIGKIYLLGVSFCGILFIILGSSLRRR